MARMAPQARALGLALVPARSLPRAVCAIERSSSSASTPRSTSRPTDRFVVEETIVPRFTGSWNGIFRTIPVQYRTPQGLNYTLRLDIESVTDAEGAR